MNDMPDSQRVHQLDDQRRRFLKRITVGTAALGIGGAAGTVWSQSQRTPGIEGLMAPELNVGYWIDENGEETSSFSVKESTGKWTLLKCFQNWCPGCHSSGFPTLKAFADEFHDHPDVAIAGIQTVFEGHRSNTRDAVRELQLRYELPIVMGHDPGNPDTHEVPQTMADYRTGGTPWIILINPDGMVVFNGFHVNSDRLIQFVSEQLGSPPARG